MNFNQTSLIGPRSTKSLFLILYALVTSVLGLMIMFLTFNPSSFGLEDQYLLPDYKWQSWVMAMAISLTQIYPAEVFNFGTPLCLFLDPNHSNSAPEFWC